MLSNILNAVTDPPGSGTETVSDPSGPDPSGPGPSGPGAELPINDTQ